MFEAKCLTACWAPQEKKFLASASEDSDLGQSRLEEPDAITTIIIRRSIAE